ncbi:MAG: cytidylate kinase-like family protein [Lachnospiraceae bacterium]|nr:cytidylate kinase-like family protein [Lachnospiraceae bacterium]
MEQHIVVTIARQFGSGGKTIGQMLAKDMGVKCYEKEILRMASEESGINEALFNEADEKLKRTPIFGKTKGEYKGRLISPESDEFVSDHNLFNYQAKIIRDLAAQESCVVIGRAADYVLKDHPGLVSVFVHAPRVYCVRQAIERNAYTGKDVEKFVEKTDKYRSDFYNYYTGNKWNDARNYDLCLNSQRLGFEGVMEAIEAYIRIRFGKLPNE